MMTMSEVARNGTLGTGCLRLSFLVVKLCLSPLTKLTVMCSLVPRPSPIFVEPGNEAKSCVSKGFQAATKDVMTPHPCPSLGLEDN